MRKQWLAGGFTCLLGFVSAFANAGHYEINTNSSGLSFSASPGGGTPIYGPGTCTATIGGGSGSCSLTGAISTTFTWVKDRDASNNEITGDVPPAKVIIVHTSNLTSDSKAYPAGTAPTATADNKSAHTEWYTTNTDTTPAITIPIPAPPYLLTIGTEHKVEKKGTYAEIVNGGSSVTVTLSPTATASSGSGPYSIIYDYSVSAYPVTVDVTGCKVDDDLTHRILPGQAAGGTMSCSAPSTTLSSYSWTVPGEVFKTYVAATAAGHVSDLDSGELNKSTPAWKWKKHASPTVQGSATATYLSVSLGSISGSRPVTVVKPDRDITYVFHNPPTQKYSGIKIYSGNTFEDAINMTYHARTPADMLSGSYGQVGIAQNIQWTFTRTLSGVSQPDSDNTDDFVCDNSYPYQAFSPDVDIASVDKHAVEYHSKDNPNINALAVTGLNVAGSMTAFDWLMYIPPGVNSSAVPLMMFGWSWTLDATRGASSWTITTNLCEETTGKADQSTHPEWDGYTTNS